MVTELEEALDDATAQLAAANVPNARVDAELLFAHALHESRGRIQALAVSGAMLPNEDVAAILALVARRAQREPLQHITGRAPFRRIELEVGPGVFVPRPETEWVAQLAIDELILRRAGAETGLTVVDFCTGSGAIALAVATEVAGVNVWAVEKSAEAYDWAIRNRDRLGVSNLVIEHTELNQSLPQLDGQVDVLISNPPYIPEGAVPRDLEVRKFDPELALYGGPDGLDIVREVSQNAHRLLRARGLLVIEHGELQGDAIRQILANDGFTLARTHQDFTGRDRATTALR